MTPSPWISMSCSLKSASSLEVLSNLSFSLGGSRAIVLCDFPNRRIDKMEDKINKYQPHCPDLQGRQGFSLLQGSQNPIHFGCMLCDACTSFWDHCAGCHIPLDLRKTQVILCPLWHCLDRFLVRLLGIVSGKDTLECRGKTGNLMVVYPI